MRVNGDLLIDDDLTVLGGTQVIQGSFPSLELAHPAAVANQRRWLQTTDGALFHFQALDDFNNVLASPLVLDRSGNASFSGMLTAGTAIRVRVSGNDVFFADGLGRVTTKGDITISKTPRPTLIIEDTAKPLWRARLFQAVTASPRIDLTSNAYYDGTNWQRDDTATNGIFLGLTTSNFLLRSLAGGPPAATTDRFLVDMTNGNVTVYGVLAVMNGAAAVSASGAVRLPNVGGAITARNAANTADMNLIQGFSDNKVYVGANANDAGLVLRSSGGVIEANNQIRSLVGANGVAFQFGGATSAYPALRYNGTTIEVVTADNGQWAHVQCNNLTLQGALTVTGQTIFNNVVYHQGNILRGAQLSGYAEQFSQFMGVSGGWITCDCSLFNCFGVNADQNFNIQFINRKPDNQMHSITVIVLHNGGPFTIYWPAYVRWPNSNAGDNSGAPGGSSSYRADVYTFLTWSNSGVMFGTAVKHFVWW